MQFFNINKKGGLKRTYEELKLFSTNEKGQIDENGLKRTYEELKQFLSLEFNKKLSV